MQISDILNQLNQQSMSTGSMTAASGATQEYSAGSQTLSELQEGEVFEGTVMDVENGKVTISLANGSSIQARLDSGVSLTQGLATFFQVKSNQGGQIALKAVTQDNFANPTLVKALNQAGVQVSVRNLDLVKEMMAKQLPIDTKSVLGMVRAANTFSSASVATLTQLQKLSLPINELNIEQLEHYNQGEGQIQKNLEDIMKALPKLIQEAPGQAEGLSVAKQVLSLFVSGNGTAVTEPFVGKTSAAETSGQATGLTEDTGQVSNPAESTVQAQEQETVIGQPQDLTVDTGQVQEQAGNPGQVQGKGTANGQTQGPPVGAQAMQESDNQQNPVQVSEAAGKEASEGKLPVTGIGVDSFAPMDMKTSLNISPGSESLKELDPAGQLQKILEWIDQGQVSKEELSEMFGKRDLQNLLQNAVRKQWFISPQEVEDKQKLEELYERIDRQMSKLQDIFEGAGHKDSPVVRQMADTRNNISFLNQLNQAYNYVQIPLRMANQNATGDLYVYTNRKNLAKKDGEISAHLHLEMEHLGITDVFVKLNAKKLSTNFVMEDEKSLELVMDHIDVLTDRLQKKGYEVDVQVKENPNKEQQAMFMQEVMGQQQPLQSAVSRYSFDVKV